MSAADVKLVLSSVFFLPYPFYHRSAGLYYTAGATLPRRGERERPRNRGSSLSTSSITHSLTLDLIDYTLELNVGGGGE